MKQELLHDNYLEMRFSRVFSFIKELVSLRLMLLCVLVISGLTLGTQEAKGSCTTPTSGFAASANRSTVYISNTAYAEVTLSTSQTADVYQWECVSHPSYGTYNTPTIVSSTASSTTVQLPIEGTYTFRVGAKCTADAAYTYSETVTVTANLNLWMKGPLYQNGWGSPTNVAWSISNNVRTYTLIPAYYNTGAQPREFVLNAYETSDDGHHIHSSTTSINNQLTLTGIEYYNSYNLRALESLFSGANKNLKLTVTHQGGVYYDITLSDLCTPPSAFTFGAINRISCTQANMAWSASAPALLVRYLGSSPSITNPTSGQSYSSGNTIGGGTVVYSGTADNYTATFDADKIYTFVLYRVSPSGYCYSTSASTTLAAGVPALTTATATSVGGTVATLGGNISSKGAGGSIKSRGIEWTATVGGKTAGNREEIDKTDATGAFSKEFTGLTGSTTYKYKAYATNNSCESSYGYGAEESFTTSTSCTTPTSGFAASGTYNSGNWTTRFANDYRTASLSTNQVADAYLWECTSANSSKVSIASNTSKSTTATFDLPGEYTFRVGAKCTSDGGYTYSETVTVNVPYPDMGISGPFYDGKWDHPKAGTDGKFTRNGLVYTKDFTVNTSSGEFVIIQAYKLGCEFDSGWAGYQECSSISGSNGNKINCSTLNTSTINTGSCGNFTQKVGLSNGQTARLTVTMTAFDSYTMLLGLACTPPTGGTATASASSVCSGSGTTITLTGNTGTIQWQSSTNGTDYSNISGQTSSTLSTGNLTVKTWYRAVLTSDGCTSNSSVATVDIYPTSVGGTATATASTVCSGSGTTISLSGNTGTIQWQSSTDGTNYSDISGQTSSTLSTGNLTVKTWYRAVVTSGSCSSANSSAATVDISPASVGGTATASASSVCSGSGTTITLTGNTGTIQWQSSTNGTDYSDISGETSSALSTGNLTVKTWYRAVVTSGSCSSNSSAAEVTIKTSPVLSAISGSATTTQYKPETYNASGSNLGTLTWAIVGAPAHANISATTGSSTVFKAKDGSYTLSVTATNDGCTDNETKGITVSTDSETCP